MSNRADRRRAQRNAQKEEQLAKQAAARQFEKDVKRDGVFDARAAWQNPHYMREVIAMRKSERDGWNRNGITKADLDREYQRGYKAAQKEMAAFYGKYFFASVAVALCAASGFQVRQRADSPGAGRNVRDHDVGDHDMRHFEAMPG